MAPAPALMDEIVEEILLRIPPDDPARLLDAALVCKQWCHVASDAGFRRRFREFHRTAPMLGFLGNYGPTSSFISTSSFRAPPADRVISRTIDVRHGRVLLQSWYSWGHRRYPWEDAFHVWDPIMGDRRELPLIPPGPVYPSSWNAAVLCAIDGCQHLHCHRGPFLVVFVGSDEGQGMCAHVYSSEADAWSHQISAPQLQDEDIQLEPCVLAENALYFRCSHSVLKYDLATQELSLIHLPEESFFWGRTLLMPSEYGGLGLAYICSPARLYLCSWQAGVGRWASKAINLTPLLPADDPPGSPDPIGFAHGLDLLFVRTSVGIFTIHLKSMRVTKVCQGGWYDASFPYMSFCTPGYLGDKDSTCEILDSEGWLRTGDVCYIDQEGFIYIVDRLKEIIKHKGYQVPPAEHENLLQIHPDIDETAVVPYHDDEAGELPVAFIVKRPGSQHLHESHVKEFVAKQIVHYKRFHHVFIVDSIPKNAAGKILRNDLAKVALRRISSKL